LPPTFKKNKAYVCQLHPTGGDEKYATRDKEPFILRALQKRQTANNIAVTHLKAVRHAVAVPSA